jgi:hypothetical protein
VIVADQSAELTSQADSRLDAAELRLLAGMPLHAISSVHGEAGLRERMAMEIARFPAADRGRAQDALTLASRLDAADRRQRGPYASHLLRVTIRILSTTGLPIRTWHAPRYCTTPSRTTPVTSRLAAGRRPWQCWRGGSAHRRCGHQPRLRARPRRA